MQISEKLKELGLVSGPKTLEVFDDIYNDILDISYVSESQLISELWTRYLPKMTPHSQALNGKVFEGILAVILYRSNISPFYIEEKIDAVPDVSFDILAYSEEYGPVVLSAKTSLRERYKQAILEGRFLKLLHNNAQSYLITLDKTEAGRLKKKVEAGQTQGLDKVLIADEKEFDFLIQELKKLTYISREKAA